MNSWTRYTLSSAVLLAALGAGIVTHRACTAAPDATAGNTTASAAFLTTRLPDISATPRALDDWKGKIRVVNFWATWCPPCREEIPMFMQAQQRWAPQGVQFVGIAIDTADAVKPFATQMKINYPLLLAEEQGPPLMAAQGNNAGVLPYTLVLDGRGRILQRHAGEVRAAELERWLKAATAVK